MSMGELTIPEGMKDIKPPVDINLPHPWFYYAIFFGAAFLLIILIFVLVRRYLRRNITGIDAEIIISPERGAFDRIDGLEEDLKSLAITDKKEVWFILYDILKEYIEAKAAMDGRCGDESEIMKPASSSFTQSMHENLKNIMEKLTFLKFSGSKPEDDEICSMISVVRSFINQSSDSDILTLMASGGKDELQV